jgi:hypothetical protein
MVYTFNHLEIDSQLYELRKSESTLNTCSQLLTPKGASLQNLS